MRLQDQISIAIKAEAARSGATQGTCAGLYSMAIGVASSESLDYWAPINQAISARFGNVGLSRVKNSAWQVHDHAAAALKAALAH